MEMADIIAKLRRASSTRAIFGTRVGGAADASRVIEYSNLTPPCAYVAYLSDAAEPNQGRNEVNQLITETWAIAVKLPATEDIRGQAPTHIVPAVRDALFRAILNWSPDKAWSNLSYGGCRLLAVNRDITVWLFSFLTETTVCAEDAETEEQFDPLPDFLRMRIRLDYLDPFDPGRPPSLAYDPRYRPPRDSGPDGRIEGEFHIDVPQTRKPQP